MNLNSKISSNLVAFLAMYILLVSSGLTVDLHFCQKQLKTFGLFAKAKTCHDLTQQNQPSVTHCQKAQSNKNDSLIAKKGTASKSACCSSKSNPNNCCQNELVVFELGIDYTIGSLSDVNFEPKAIAVSIELQKEFCLAESHILATFHYQNYKPPLLDRAKPALTQSFLC